jgi:Chaperone of endosialidase
MSTFSTNLALELIGNGEQAGNWGQTTNTNLGTLVEQAISGYTTQAISDVADTTLAMTQGASATARNMYIELTGALTGARNLVVPSNRKLYFIYNNTTGGFAVTVKVSGQTGVSVTNATKTILVSNGTDIVLATTPPTAGVTSVSTSGTVNGLTLTGGPITSTGTITLGGSLSGTASGLTVGSATNATNATYATYVSGTVAVANGGTGQSSLTAAGIITTGGGQTISGTLNTTGRIVMDEMFVNTSTSLGGYGAKGQILFNGAVQSGFTMQTSGAPAVNLFIFMNSSSSVVGSIYMDPPANQVTYNTASDYRLKHSIAPMTGALAKVTLLKPCTFKWKNNDIESQGFIAHELQEVVKQCVTGEKDALNEDGSIKPQGVDTGFLVATLTAAIQELKALVDVQASRITALEAKVG